jgi:hypothetical protein
VILRRYSRYEYQNLKGNDKMSRYSKLRYELIENINSQVKFGQSKHEVKRQAIKAAREKGERFTAVQGIYSYSTRDSYIKETERFARWVTSNFNCKSTKSAKQYVHNYIKRDIERGLSPWTIHTRAFALASAFRCPVSDFGVDLPKRERRLITRSRLHTRSDEQTTALKYDRLRQFARATGARRGGLEKLRANDLREREGGGLEIHLLEKGGKHRWARVNPHSEAIVREYFDLARERGEDALVFPKGTLSNRVDIHACRGEYARDMYQIYESENRGNGNLYKCRNERKGDVYDKGILMLVSKDLGHSRCDVVVNHYMR